MNHRFAKVLLASCILAGSAIPARAGCDNCRWADRGDRWEGVVERELVSGGSFELLGVHNQRLEATASDSDQLHLSFWLPEPQELEELWVWQPVRFYQMEPARKRFDGGRQGFSWPRGEVIARLGLSVDSLYARIMAGAVYFPALLSAGERSTPTEGYAFVFLSGGGIDANCTIARRAEGPRVVRRFECFEDYGGTLVIEWDGRDDRGQPVPEGVYVLNLKGDMLAETLRPLHKSVVFWHREPSAGRPPRAEPEEEHP